MPPRVASEPMGIAKNFIPCLIDSFQAHGLGGSILTLGRQDIETGESPESFFRGLGFSKVESLDISKSEGADIAFDLNQQSPPENLRCRCDVLFDGGTLEHVFHVPNALANCSDMIRPDGWFVHLGPLDNWVDHGFYQFSPTIWFDWFMANNWEVTESTMIKMGKEWSFSVLPPGKLGTAGEMDKAPYMHYLVARKLSHATANAIPMQAYYSTTHRPPLRLREFSPFVVANGKKKSRSWFTRS